MNEYRKKVEAFQMTRERGDDNSEWPSWLNDAWQKEPRTPGSLYRADVHVARVLAIGTLEGEMIVGWGDWIIRGVQGEIYPCKPDIFDATYEAAVAGEPQDGEASIIEVVLERAVRASGDVHLEAIQGMGTDTVVSGILHALTALALIQHERLEAQESNAEQIEALGRQLGAFMEQSSQNATKPLTVIHEVKEPGGPPHPVTFGVPPASDA